MGLEEGGEEDLIQQIDQTQLPEADGQEHFKNPQFELIGAMIESKIHLSIFSGRFSY
jgi:hypothetical protein